MRVLGLNIRQGGGSRVPRLAKALLSRNPDAVVLGEYHANGAGRELARLLERGGLIHQARGSDDPSVRGVFLAATTPFSLESIPEWPDEERHRVLVASFEGLRLIATYFPATAPHIAEMFVPLLAATARLRGRPTLLVGDLNAGLNPADTEGAALSAGARFGETLEAGWIDLWRECNPDRREFTWYSPGARNGFRLDHALLLGADPNRVEACRYDHTIRRDQISDHSLLEVSWSE